MIGVSMISPDGLAIRPRMPASCFIWAFEPRAPECAIMKTELSSRSRPSSAIGRLDDLVHHRVGDLVGGLGPGVDDLVVLLALGDEAVGVLLLVFLDQGLRVSSTSVSFGSG